MAWSWGSVSGHSALLAPSVVALLAAVLLGANIAWAEIPQKINYQGLLLDKDTGEALVGPLDVIFALYTLPGGGVAEWSETHSVTPDSDGVFSVVLGGVYPIDLAFEDPMWLELAVDGEVLAPRRGLE